MKEKFDARAGLKPRVVAATLENPRRLSLGEISCIPSRQQPSAGDSARYCTLEAIPEVHSLPLLLKRVLRTIDRPEAEYRDSWSREDQEEESGRGPTRR